MHFVTEGFRNVRALSLSSPYTVCHLTWFSHFSCFLRVVLFPFFYFKETSRFSISRSFKQSCRATNRERIKLPKEKRTCKKMYILCFPPTWGCSVLSEWLFLSWNAAAVGSKTFSLQSAAQQRSQGTERAVSLQRVHKGSRGKKNQHWCKAIGFKASFCLQSIDLSSDHIERQPQRSEGLKNKEGRGPRTWKTRE